MSLGQLKLSMSKTRLSHSAPSPHHDPTSLSFQIFRIPPFSSRLDLILFAVRIFFFFFFNIYLLGCAGSQLRQTDCCGMWDLVP